jgi:hypothetical protein
MRHPKNQLDIPNRTLTKQIFIQQKSANAILKISAILIFFLGKFHWYILGLCTTNWLLQIEKKNLVYGGRTSSKVAFTWCYR